ncbi:hypothetical protein M9H77_06190 [Catharanthus roseus]|uniref:Uncharacterized protein n=1 Tax=Catharanthus roseus TaxID=4058 RepID=A0ACC0BRJ2_CATRO|nr:hypothetical protein M9H77_06190 [Catharanthus roseus]
MTLAKLILDDIGFSSIWAYTYRRNAATGFRMRDLGLGRCFPGRKSTGGDKGRHLVRGRSRLTRVNVNLGVKILKHCREFMQSKFVLYTFMLQFLPKKFEGRCTWVYFAEVLEIISNSRKPQITFSPLFFSINGNLRESDDSISGLLVWFVRLLQKTLISSHVFCNPFSTVTVQPDSESYFNQAVSGPLCKFLVIYYQD